MGVSLASLGADSSSHLTEFVPGCAVFPIATCRFSQSDCNSGNRYEL